MKHLVPAVSISPVAFVAVDARAWPALQGYHSKVETQRRCEWLSAGSEDIQQGQDKRKAEGEYVPDCD